MSSELTFEIRSNFEKVSDSIKTALGNCDRADANVKIVTVSKKKPSETIRAAIEAGITDFGENYPEEAVQKMAELSAKNIVWHMIGHVQSRKINLVVENFDIVHSIDSLKVAEKMNSKAASVGKVLPVLLECNVSGEISKFGFDASDHSRWTSLIEDFAKFTDYTNLSVVGLMTMPPWSENPENARPYFSALRSLKEKVNHQIPELPIKELSMGTSGDYIEAVKEGATIVRIGTAILGTRVN